MSKRTKAAKPKRRLSLGVKWTAIVGIGIFATFLAFSVALFAATRQILVNQEKNTVSDTINAVQQRLSPVAGQLTIAKTVPRIDGTTSSTTAAQHAQSDSQNTIFSDSVIQKLSRADISVTVYDLSGDVVFTSRQADLGLIKTGDVRIKETATSNFDGLVGSAPIESTINGKRIGYVQVTDKMADFHATMRRMGRLLWLLAGLALLTSIAIGSFLAYRFVKPLKAITKTIDIVNDEPQSSARIPELKRNDELSDLIKQFNGMLDRLQRFIDQQSDFVQDVSHELRTPVAILEGHLQLLDRWGKKEPEVLDESLAASLQEVARMKSLIQEMLDLTRADQVDVQFPNAVVDVNQTVPQVVNDFTMIHPDFRFTLDNDLAGSTFVRMYRNHLEQVLIILLDNGVKYSEARKELHISVSEDSDGVAIAVQDFGEGISTKDKARVFNRFYRVDKARSREKGGNGLGLAIAQQLIESYRGQISVDSAVGHGSVFRVDLPVISAAEATRLQAQEDKVKTETSQDLSDHSNL